MNQWLERNYPLGDLHLQGGGVLRDAHLRVLMRGQIGAPGTELVLLPTWYGGSCHDNLPLTEQGPLADPRYSILIVGMLGSGESSSPGNAHASQQGAAWPEISLADQVNAQRRMLETLWPDYRLALVAGWSMAGMQSLQWGCLFPDRVQRIASWCAASRCYPINRLFLRGLKAALCADPELESGGHPQSGLRAFARVYASRAYGAGFWRGDRWRELGFASEQALLDEWDRDHLAANAFNLLAVLDTWMTADISANPVFALDHAASLSAIRAPTLIMPCTTDSYFLLDEVTAETQVMSNATLQIIESDWGHCAGGPGRCPAVMNQLFAALELLMRDGGAF